MKANKIKYPQYETYIELCKTKTEAEIADIMHQKIVYINLYN